MSIVRNRKFVYTLAPSAGGRLIFVIGASPAGLLWQVDGADFSSQHAEPSVAAQYGYVMQPATRHYGLRAENYMGVVNTNVISPGADSACLDWRVMSLRAVVRSSGPPLTTSGTFYGKQFNTLYPSQTFAGTAGTFDYATVQPQTFPSPPDNRTVVGAAKDTYSTLLVPRDTSFERPRRCVTGLNHDNQPFGGNYAPHSSLPMAYYDYAGLSQDTRITVEIDVCCQTLLDPDSSLIPYAKPSEQGEPLFLSRVLTMLSNQPAVRNGLQAFGKHLYDGAMALAGRAIYQMSPLALAGF